jgi:hypothetical protein
MPFIVALNCDPQRFYFMQQDDGTVLLTTNRAKATPFPEERADMLAAAHNIYTLAAEAVVEGTKGAAA